MNTAWLFGGWRPLTNANPAHGRVPLRGPAGIGCQIPSNASPRTSLEWHALHTRGDRWVEISVDAKPTYRLRSGYAPA